MQRSERPPPESRCVAIRRPSIAVTVSTRSWHTTASPASGNLPRPAIRNPAAVSYGPGGSAMPVTSAKSSRFSRPSTSSGGPVAPFTAAGRPSIGLHHLPDDLLDQVLQGDDAVGAAVLVHHHREMLTRGTHLLQGIEHHLGAGHHRHRLADIADTGRTAERMTRREQIPQVHHADHLVRVVADHGVPGVRVGQRGPRRPGHRHGAGRNSTSGRGTITSRTRVVSASKTSTIIRRSTNWQRFVGQHERAQFVLAHHLAAGSGGSTRNSRTNRSEERPSNQTTGRNSRASTASGPARGQRDALTALQPEPFRRELADAPGAERDDQRDQHQGHRVGDVLGSSPARSHDCAHSRRDRRGAEGRRRGWWPR